MPIDTPNKALTLDELPTASAADTAIQVVVNTAKGAKKLPLGEIFQPYNILIGSYQYYASHGIPHHWAIPMLGGVLNPADFVDSLITLKHRIPAEWILSNGHVQLPLILDHVLQQDLSLNPGEFQGDAIRNITGYFSGGVNGSFTGPFSHGHVIHTVGSQGGAVPAANQTFFDVSRSVPVAAKNRENTFNAFLCILSGQTKSIHTKRYWLIDPVHGEYLGGYLDLVLGLDDIGIGFNSQVMTAVAPVEISQVELYNQFLKQTQSDPLGLAMQVRSRNQFTFVPFDPMYRSFRIAGKDVIFTASMDGIRVTGGDGTDSITFTGNTTYNSGSAWGSKYGTVCSCNAVIINSAGFDSFTITGLPGIHIEMRVKENTALLSMVSGGNPLDSSWWSRLDERCPSEHKSKLASWLMRMPNGIYNLANANDVYDSIPQSRFYFHSLAYTNDKSETQRELFDQFTSNNVSDNLGLYTAAGLSDFSLENFLDKTERTFWLEGKKMTLSASSTEIKWMSEDGYYLRSSCVVTLQNLSNFSGQTQQIVFQTRDDGWYFGGPGVTEINTVRGYTLKFLLVIKGDVILFSFAGGLDYLDKGKIDALMSAAPAGREADLRQIFEHIPIEWENTMNQDTIGSNWGTLEARFWMKGRSHE